MLYAPTCRPRTVRKDTVFKIDETGIWRHVHGGVLSNGHTEFWIRIWFVHRQWSRTELPIVESHNSLAQIAQNYHWVEII